MRLDIYLTKHLAIASRNKASELIKSNKVLVNKTIITKASFIVDESMSVELIEDDILVSRAGYKLKYFLAELDLDLSTMNGLDIGSSTGGFAQVLLQKGISKLTCVDVGTNQLHQSLKSYKNLEFFENCDIRDFNPNTTFDIITCDISFISLHHILKDIDRLAKKHIIILFKPQFEVGKIAKRDKHGVVKDEKAIKKAMITFGDACSLLGWELIYQTKSKLSGKEGNDEEFYYYTKTNH